MADAILADIAIDIVKKLGSLGLRQTRLWWGVKEELEKLRVAVSMIQAVLLDAEEQYSLSHQVKVWVDSLKEAFYDADDLLDEFSTDVLLKQMITGNKMLREKDTKATCARIGPRLVTYQILVLIKDGFKRMAATNYDYKNQKFLLENNMTIWNFFQIM